MTSLKTKRNQRWLEKNPDYYREWQRKNPAYASWKSMVQRCTNPNSPNWPRYGGRGITVCSRWLDSYENFLSDVGQRPGLDYSIDRINNDGDYEPGNCRWATRSEQQQNKRSAYTLESVQRIQELRGSGMSWRGIAKVMNDEGFNTPRGRQWYGVTAKDAIVRHAVLTWEQS